MLTINLSVRQIRRYKASSAVMEKATEVYNKLKLQFVGKVETNKPKPQEKDEGEEEKTEPTSIGNLSLLTDLFCLFFFFSLV